jgi:hypothetical protein
MGSAQRAIPKEKNARMIHPRVGIAIEPGLVRMLKLLDYDLLRRPMSSFWTCLSHFGITRWAHRLTLTEVAHSERGTTR